MRSEKAFNLNNLRSSIFCKIIFPTCFPASFKIHVYHLDAKSDKMFPDEVDTPMDSLARIRFQKYRGLKSFRTSPWDPKENLPADYARIFQFENFKRTEKTVRKNLEDKDGAQVIQITLLILFAYIWAAVEAELI